MTSLTTMTATSSLMHSSNDDRAAYPEAKQPPKLAPSRIRAVAAVLSCVITVSLLGGVAIGMTTTADVTESIAQSGSI